MCPSNPYLIQSNGLCTSCNAKVKLHAKLSKLQVADLAGNGPAPRPSVHSVDRKSLVSHATVGGGEPLQPQEKGTAFGGRLEYSFVRFCLPFFVFLVSSSLFPFCRVLHVIRCGRTTRESSRVSRVSAAAPSPSSNRWSTISSCASSFY